MFVQFKMQQKFNSIPQNKLPLYKAITATTAMIPASKLPLSTFSCPGPSLSAPLLVEVDDELPPCEKLLPLELVSVLVLPLPLPEIVAVDPEFATTVELESELWLLLPGSPPLRPGTVSAVAVAEAEAVVPVPETGAPACKFRPVPWKEARTVAFWLSTTVSLVPE